MSHPADAACLIVNRHLRVPLDEFTFSFARSSGPGGQNVNKVNTKATLRWPVAVSPSLSEEVRQRLMSQQRRRVTQEGELLVISQRYRDQGRNIQDCLDKLREMLAAAAERPTPRKKLKPTRGMIERRLKAKRVLSAKKQGRRHGGGVEE